MELLGKFIVIAIIIVLCLMPFVIMNIKRKKEEQQRLQSMANFATQKNCNITQHEFCGELTLGLDEKHHIFVFLRRTKGNDFFQEANLAEVQQFKLVISHKISKSTKQNVIDKVQLICSSTVTGIADCIFELYNSENSIQLIGELELGEKWAKLLNARITQEKKQVELVS